MSSGLYKPGNTHAAQEPTSVYLLRVGGCWFLVERLDRDGGFLLVRPSPESLPELPLQELRRGRLHSRKPVDTQVESVQHADGEMWLEHEYSHWGLKLSTLDEVASGDWYCGAWYRDLRVAFFRWPHNSQGDRVVRVCTSAGCMTRLHERFRATLARNHSIEDYDTVILALREEEARVWDQLERDGWEISTTDPSCRFGCGDVPISSLELIPCEAPQ